METITECAVCSNTEFKPLLTCTDYLVSKQAFSIETCNKCGFRFTNPRPDINLIGDYYQSEQYVSHNDENRGLLNTAYRLVRKYTLQSKLKLINKLNDGPGRLLDVGCGTGAFLETCQAGNWTVAGMEPDKNARAIAQKKIQPDISSSLETIPTNRGLFDIITLWHVLEHIPDLNKTIRKLRQLLAPNGTLIIAVPNSDSYDAQYFKEFWAAYDLPRHLHHFTPLTVKTLFKNHDLTLVEQKPMLFDAFYIAMLSTKYKTGKTDYVKSVRVGLKSNQEAKSTGNSSSQIYLFKKAQ